MRAFIVGNGPSLAKTNLEHLQNEISFGCNRISDIYKDTSWRPTHYVRAEEAEMLSPDIYTDDMTLHTMELKCEVWANGFFVKEMKELTQQPNFHIINGCPHYLNNYDDDNCPHLWHLPMLCTFGSTVNVAIQIAVQQGYSPIYLVGCDLGYKDGQPNHYTGAYEKGLEGALRPARYANLNTLAAHMIAARMKAPVFNATIGGELEVYDRVSYESLFS